MPDAATMIDRKSVKKVKLATNPITTPNGRLFPELSTDEERIIGRTGKIHGERIVTTPARKEKARRRNISL